MHRVTPKAPQVYQIAALPGALDPEIRAKEAEIAFTKSPRGTARLVACIAVAAFGVLGLMYSVFYTLVPWFYGVSVVAVGIGGAASKKFWLERKEGPKTMADWRTCQSDTAAGTPFRQVLESGAKKEFTWAKIQEAHGHFKQARTCVN
jgi:hypothetical protein